ncbi:MAG: hypothetical protein RLZZ620_1090 [Pseudomonadota bacterium]
MSQITRHNVAALPVLKELPLKTECPFVKLGGLLNIRNSKNEVVNAVNKKGHGLTLIEKDSEQWLLDHHRSCHKVMLP